MMEAKPQQPCETKENHQKRNDPEEKKLFLDSIIARGLKKKAEIESKLNTKTLKRPRDEEKGDANTNNVSQPSKRLKTQENAISDEIIQVLETKKDNHQPTLSQSQKAALEVILSGNNVFLTGEAGSGKSYLIKHLQKLMKEQHKIMYTTATTGQAAWNISGTTLHKYMCVGLATEDINTLRKKISGYKNAVNKFKQTHVLLVDEVSMLEEEFADKCDQLLRYCIGIDKPFGGIQLILVGDFFQLPPVNKGKTKCLPLFNTQVWKRLNLTVCNLTSNFRQQKDDEYKSFLNRLRVGQLHDTDLELMESRTFLDHESFEDYTFLVAFRHEAEAINKIHLEKLPLPEHSFIATTNDLYTNTSFYQNKYPVDEELKLRIGTKVILCCNLDLRRGLYNGTSGTVVDFRGSKENNNLYPIVQFDNGIRETIKKNTWNMMEGNRIVNTFTQIPLILIYACTIHRVQGLTLKKVKVSPHVFACGQLYVACSRVGCKEDIILIDEVDVTKTLLSDKLVYEYYKRNKLISE